MKKPDIPENETERLAYLHDLDMLDTFPEQAFDDITRISSEICQTPIALISLIDSERQFFKSKIGIEGSETSRDVSFCAHAINEPDQILEVTNAFHDARFADNPDVVGGIELVFYTGIPLVSKEGLALGTLCVIDKKPRKLSESQLQALKCLTNQVMYLIELRVANRKLEAAREELSIHAAEMGNFAFAAAHDLKEPLRMVKQFVRLLKEKYGNQLDPKANEYIHFALNGVEKMNQLIQDLLTFAEVGSKNYGINPVNLENILQDVVSLHGSWISDVQASITWDTLPLVTGQKTPLLVLFSNLLSNALKYRKKEGTVEIHLEVEEKANYFKLALHDNGIGIAPADSSKIFQLFGRVYGKEVYPGTGLGLATCKKIIESHGGEIWVTSSLGEGSVFHFTLAK